MVKHLMAENKEAHMTTERPLGSSYVLEDVIGRGAMGQVWRGGTETATSWRSSCFVLS